MNNNSTTVNKFYKDIKDMSTKEMQLLDNTENSTPFDRR